MGPPRRPEVRRDQLESAAEPLVITTLWLREVAKFVDLSKPRPWGLSARAMRPPSSQLTILALPLALVTSRPKWRPLAASPAPPVYIHPKSCVQYVLLKGVEGA